MGRALSFYNYAWETVQASGYNSEVLWQDNLNFDTFSEADLMREAAWVILCSGFKEAIVRRVFDPISLCFHDWVSAKDIVLKKNECIELGMKVFPNSRKIFAIWNVADRIHSKGFDYLKKQISEDPIKELKKLNMIGDITVWHLAKNLGCQLAKPDRHLVRIAAELGYSDCHILCSELSGQTGHSVPVVDIVLWRYAVIKNKLALSA